VLPELAGELHPFPGRYHPSLLPRLEEGLEADAPLRRTLEQLDPRRLDANALARFGSAERLLFNVNSPADLERARRSLPQARPAR
jgi:molybdopterin-guanine dinucleotide biosynthesis protein A